MNKTSAVQTIGILTSGGDAPGMNAALRAVARTAWARGIDVKGIYRGYSGLLNDEIFDMEKEFTCDIISRGGTALFTARCEEFKQLEYQEKAAEILRSHNIDGLVVIGGDGSFRGAQKLSAQGINTVALPGTIDLDIACTEYTIGFDTAVKNLRAGGIEVIVHTILGLPGESRKDILETMAYLNAMDIQGIKLQLLHVLRGTDLAADHEAGLFRTYERDEYLNLVIDCLEHLRPDIVIHRVTGDGPKDLLIAPLWASRKREVLNLLHHRMKERASFQGKALEALSRSQ